MAGKWLTGGFLPPLARSNSVPKEQQQLNLSAPPPTPPKLPQTSVYSRAHWFPLSGLAVSPETNKRLHTAVPTVSIYSSRRAASEGKGIQIKCESEQPLLPPDSSLGFSYVVGFTSPGAPLSELHSELSKTLASPQGAICHQTYYPPLCLLFCSQGPLSRKKPLSGREREGGLTGPVSGRKQPRWTTFSLINTITPQGRQHHSSFTDMETEAQRREFFNWDIYIYSGLHSVGNLNPFSVSFTKLLWPWSEHTGL